MSAPTRGADVRVVPLLLYLFPFAVDLWLPLPLPGGSALPIAGVLLALPVALVVVRRLVIGRDERYLASRFGEDYRSYCGRAR